MPYAPDAQKLENPRGDRAEVKTILMGFYRENVHVGEGFIPSRGRA